MEEIFKFKELNRLKLVPRANSVGNRKESSAEHSWSSLLLADLLLNEVNKKLDRLKIYEILMYHDLVEIEAGDIALDPINEVNINNKKEIEFAAAKIVKSKLPIGLQDKFFNLFLEFEKQKTIEARFAKAIDVFDAIIQEIDYKTDWKGWSKDFLISQKEIFFRDFPKILNLFHNTIDYLEKEGYFNQ